MISFRDFLQETYKTYGKKLRGDISASGLDCRGEIVLHMGNDMFLKQCETHYIIEENGKIVFFQEYTQKENVLKLGARQKFTGRRGIFNGFLIAVLTLNKYKYIEDDEPHSESSAQSIERLVENNRLSVRVYDRLRKQEIPINYSNTKLLWDMDNVIRYYSNHNTKITESRASDILKIFENPNIYELIYGLE